MKLLGAALVLLAATLFGFFQALQFARRPRQIRELISALQRLETEIVYGSTPLPEALRRLSAAAAEPVGPLLGGVAAALAQRPQTPLGELWREEAERVWKRSAMKEPEFEAFTRLGLALGLSDRTDQAKHLKLAAAQLKAEEQTAREEQKRYETMWRSLGVLVGALIVILMY
ncbi:stage III sporulation protein AB [Gordoniibacillus kamchatkensis]|uniref:Stage III sporulation protein AB n=1 Tax=Gordoniibacillus kamchatkensis TaxID=1590651 RepID=A0ABR5AJA6_9BACL|nr:stage III sporulation protein SpoIIIAB [Paenibacillus sp. VKM B-2647]KIL41116.1 stage III sporulation protein AB [Paenibacillus sp. VKM B-2647]